MCQKNSREGQRVKTADAEDENEKNKNITIH
jgi:hypothetical protein